jgi:hypothetical protein
MRPSKGSPGHGEEENVGLPALPLSGVDAVVALDTSTGLYRIYFVQTGLSGTTYSDGSAAINAAFGTSGVNIVGLYQELSCTGQVSIPSQGGLRGLGQTYGVPVMPGLKAVSPFPANTELLFFPASNSLCDVRDLTINAQNIALSAAKVAGNMGFWSGVSFLSRELLCGGRQLVQQSRRRGRAASQGDG